MTSGIFWPDWLYSGQNPAKTWDHEGEGYYYWEGVVTVQAFGMDIPADVKSRIKVDPQTGDPTITYIYVSASGTTKQCENPGAYDYKKCEKEMESWSGYDANKAHKEVGELTQSYLSQQPADPPPTQPAPAPAPPLPTPGPSAEPEPGTDASDGTAPPVGFTINPSIAALAANAGLVQTVEKGLLEPKTEDNPCDPPADCPTTSTDAAAADAPTETGAAIDLEEQKKPTPYTYDTPIIDTYKKLFVDMVPTKIYFVDVTVPDIDAFKKLQEAKGTWAHKENVPKAGSDGKPSADTDCSENPDEGKADDPSELAESLAQSEEADQLLKDDDATEKTKEETDSAMDDAAGGDPPPEETFDPYATGFQGYVQPSNIGNVTEKAGPEKGERVNFFYFGDLIDNILQGNLFTALEKEQSRIVFGPVTYENHWLGNKTTINLADVPISLNLFVRWFYYTVWKTARITYTLQDFLHDCMSQLLVPALGAHCTEGSKSYKLDMQTISVPGVQVGEHAEHRVPLGRVDLADIQDVNMIQQRYTRTENLFHYIFLYIIDGERCSSRMVGDREQDHANGTYWCEVGADVGLLKRAKFKKQKIKGAAEALTHRQMQNIKHGVDNMADVQTVKALMLWHRFNVDLEMVGNMVFRTGAHIYLDVQSMGLGKPGPRPDILKGESAFDVSAASILGIGGYYQILKSTNTIDANGWKTDLKCFFASLPGEPCTEEAPILFDPDLVQPYEPNDPGKPPSKGSKKKKKKEEEDKAWYEEAWDWVTGPNESSMPLSEASGGDPEGGTPGH